MSQKSKNMVLQSYNRSKATFIGMVLRRFEKKVYMCLKLLPKLLR